VTASTHVDGAQQVDPFGDFDAHLDSIQVGEGRKFLRNDVPENREIPAVGPDTGELQPRNSGDVRIVGCPETSGTIRTIR